MASPPPSETCVCGHTDIVHERAALGGSGACVLRGCKCEEFVERLEPSPTPLEIGRQTKAAGMVSCEICGHPATHEACFLPLSTLPEGHPVAPQNWDGVIAICRGCFSEGVPPGWTIREPQRVRPS